jgi:hypothetical protein
VTRFVPNRRPTSVNGTPSATSKIIFARTTSRYGKVYALAISSSSVRVYVVEFDAIGVFTSGMTMVDHTAERNPIPGSHTKPISHFQRPVLSDLPDARRESAKYLRDAARAERESVERELRIRLEETLSHSLRRPLHILRSAA